MPSITFPTNDQELEKAITQMESLNAPEDKIREMVAQYDSGGREQPEQKAIDAREEAVGKIQERGVLGQLGQTFLHPIETAKEIGVATSVTRKEQEETRQKFREEAPEFIKKAAEKLGVATEILEKAQQKVEALPPEAGFGERLGVVFEEFPEAVRAIMSGNFEAVKPMLEIAGIFAGETLAAKGLAKFAPGLLKAGGAALKGGGLLQGAKTLGARSLAGGLTLAGAGAGFAAPEAAQQLAGGEPSKAIETIAEEAAIFGALGAVLPVAGAALVGFGGKLIEFVLPRTAREATLLQKAAAGLGQAPRTVAETATERGIAGTETMIGKQATKKANEIFTKEVNPALEAIPEKLNKETLFAKLEGIVVKEAEPGRKAVLQDGLNAIKEDFKNITNLTYTSWQKIKSGLDNFLPQKLFKGKDVASGYNQMRFELANSIRRATYDRLADISIRNKYIDYGNLLELQKLGIQAGTGAKLRGGSGTLIHGLWDKLVTPIGTVAGLVLYRIGKGLEFLAPKGIKTVGEGLEKMGIDKATFNKTFKDPKLPDAGKIGENRPVGLFGEPISPTGKPGRITTTTETPFSTKTEVSAPERLFDRSKPSGKPQSATTKTIPKELEPLAVEARKFDTAEEFVDNIKVFGRKDIKSERGSFLEGKAENIGFAGKVNPNEIKISPSQEFLSEPLVKRIMKDIKSGKDIDPIILKAENRIDGDFIVVDGVHRIEAFKRLGLDMPILVENPQFVKKAFFDRENPLKKLEGVDLKSRVDIVDQIRDKLIPIKDFFNQAKSSK